MKTGTAVGIGVGVVGLGVLGYVLYKKYGQQANVSAGSGAGTQQQNPNILQQGVDLYKQVQQLLPQQSNSPLLTNSLSLKEGMGLRDQRTGKIYIVQGGVLRDVLGWSGWEKTGWPSKRYEDLVASGLIKQVDTATINSYSQGLPLQGLGNYSSLLLN